MAPETGRSSVPGEAACTLARILLWVKATASERACWGLLRQYGQIQLVAGIRDGRLNSSCPDQARVGELAGSLSARDLSTVLWGYGRLGAYPGVEVMETLISRARLQLADYSPHVRRPDGFVCDV